MMKEKLLHIALRIYDAKEELSRPDAELLQEAKAALSKSYSPYSKFQVGAAVRLVNGAVLSGANQESQPVFQFNTSENWNKIYFNLTGTLVTTQSSIQRLFFRLSLPKDNAGNYTQTSGTVMLDNIRVVHF